MYISGISTCGMMMGMVLLYVDKHKQNVQVIIWVSKGQWTSRFSKKNLNINLVCTLILCNQLFLYLPWTVTVASKLWVSVLSLSFFLSREHSHTCSKQIVRLCSLSHKYSHSCQFEPSLMNIHTDMLQTLSLSPLSLSLSLYILVLLSYLWVLSILVY